MPYLDPSKPDLLAALVRVTKYAHQAHRTKSPSARRIASDLCRPYMALYELDDPRVLTVAARIVADSHFHRSPVDPEIAVRLAERYARVVDMLKPRRRLLNGNITLSRCLSGDKVDHRGADVFISSPMANNRFLGSYYCTRCGLRPLADVVRNVMGVAK